MKKVVFTLILVVFCCTVAFASVNVNPKDIYTFKSNFADEIVQDINDSGETDSVIYGYIVAAINSAWDTYKGFPLFVYSESGGDVSYTTIKAGDSRFNLDTVEFIEVQSKARFFRAIYNSMKDIDISSVLKPEWFMVAIQDADNEVLYLLEVNPGQVKFRKLEEDLINLLMKTSYMDSTFNTVLRKADFRITIATYVKKYDEIVVNILFTDGDGKVYGEAILTRDRIFGKVI